jgi:cystathionine gamma-synthase
MARHIETEAVHGGEVLDETSGSVTVPIFQTSTYRLDEPNIQHDYIYSRDSNPTRNALEAAICGLEKADWCLAYSSGMAASVAVLSLLNPGDHVILADDVYGGTFNYVVNETTRYGIEHTFVDATDIDGLVEACTERTRMVWVETPSNPVLKIIDIAALAAACRQRQIVLVVDSTFASPHLQQPLELGADIVVHSTTKYLGGHSDLLGGAALGQSAEIGQRLRSHRAVSGSVPGPFDCFLVLRGIRTLAVRMDRHCANARRIAAYLASHPRASEVYYPGLPEHPGHDVASRQMRDYGGMVSFRIHGGEEAARRFVKSTRLFTLAVSLGGVESLIEIPAVMTHAVLGEAPFAPAPTVIRLSVGLEHVEDLIADLGTAFAASYSVTGMAAGPSHQKRASA